MQILVLHNNFPAQFKHLLSKLVELGHKVVFLSLESHGNRISGVKHYVIKEDSTNDKVAPRNNIYFLAKKTKISEKFCAAFHKLLEQGFYPELVFFHSGWGLGMHIRTVFPKAKLSAFAEWWFSWDSPEVDYDPTSPFRPVSSNKARFAERYQNLGQSFEINESDFVWTSTNWQRQQFPLSLQNRMSVIHEGIDIDYFTNDLRSRNTSKEITITYTTRGFEPLRAFEHFVGIARILLKNNPNFRLIVVGKDKPSYRPLPKDSKPLGVWAKELFAKDNIQDRVKWLDRLPYDQYRDILLSSDAHFYFSKPFVASWSMLEALACGCFLVTSDLEMTREIASNSALYVNHLDHKNSAETISNALKNRQLMIDYSKKARERALSYNKNVMVSKLLKEVGYATDIDLYSDA